MFCHVTSPSVKSLKEFAFAHITLLDIPSLMHLKPNCRIFNMYLFMVSQTYEKCLWPILHPICYITRLYT